MIRFFLSSSLLMVLVSSFALLVGSTQPASGGQTFEEGYFKLWPNGTIPVYISQAFDKYVLIGPHKRVKAEKKIRDGLSTWRNETNFAIRFKEILQIPQDESARFVYILTPEEFAKRTGLDVPEGCGSWGPQPQGATYIFLTIPDCINMPSILHESGHAIGLGHEHMRTDRYLYMEYNDNYQPPYEIPQDAPVGFFDYFSIMHIWGVQDNSTSLSPDVNWPTHPEVLSEGDIDTVKALYAFDIQPDKDIIGGDYASFSMSPLDFNPHRDCQLACAADVRCKAYTYAAKGTLGTDALCFLKNDDSIPFSDQLGLRSGKRKYQGSFAVARHVDLFGGQLSYGVVPMPDKLLNGYNCKELCAQDSRCDAYTYDPGWDSGIGTCYKKSYKPMQGEPPFRYEERWSFMSGVIRKWYPKYIPLP
jgi:hypothetical protein